MPEQSSTFEQCVQYAAVTDIGMRRQNNQDSLNSMVASDQSYWEQRGHLFVVADGMGAHAAGELASKMAADGIPLTYAKLTDVEPPEALRRAIADANSQIHAKGRTDAEFQGMGTTCSSLLLLPQGAVAGHVGDSRAYRLRGHRLEQLTFDHSLVWEMRAAGQIPEEEGGIHLPKNIITRSLGPNSDVRIDLEGPFPIAAGDVFLLCSDGLTGPVKDEELGAILGVLPPDQAAQMLVDLANLRGGPDNITVIVVRVVGPPVSGETVQTDQVETAQGAHPLLWLIAAICVLATGGMWLAGAKIPAALCAIGAIVAGIVALLQQFDRDTDEPLPAAPIPRLGRGPHASFDCPPNAEMVNELGKMAGEVREAAAQLGWPIDWAPFDKHSAAAEASRKSGDFAQAIRDYSQSICFAVAELKKRKQNQRLSDSHLDLI